MKVVGRQQCPPSADLIYGNSPRRTKEEHGVGGGRKQGKGIAGHTYPGGTEKYGDDEHRHIHIDDVVYNIVTPGGDERHKRRLPLCAGLCRSAVRTDRLIGTYKFSTVWTEYGFFLNIAHGGLVLSRLIEGSIRVKCYPCKP